MFVGNQRGKSLHECSHQSAAAICGSENYGSERCLCDVYNPFFIFLSFPLFLFLVAAIGFIGWCKWVKYLDIKKCLLVSVSPKAIYTNVQPSFIICGCRVSTETLTVSGCNSSSVATMWQTSFNKLAKTSQTSSCLMVGKQPVGHDKAWLTMKLKP